MSIYEMIMNDIDNIKVPDLKKQKNFLCNTIEKLDGFYSKLKCSKGKKCKINITNIKQLNLPPKVEAELFAKFYNEEEENKLKYLNN